MFSWGLTPFIVDFLAVLGIALLTWRHLRRGFFVGVAGLLSLIMTFFFALGFYRLPATWLEAYGLGRQLSLTVSFLIIFFLGERILYWWWRRELIRYIGRWRQHPLLRWLGVIPGLIEGVLIVAATLMAVGAMPITVSDRATLLEAPLAGRLVTAAATVDRKLTESLAPGAPSLFFYTFEAGSGHLYLPLDFATTNFESKLEYEVQMMDFINQERVAAGESALEFDPNLLGPARDHAADMLSHGYFSHFSQQGVDVAGRARTDGAHFFVIAENLAMAGDVRSAHEGLMASESHRANILSPLFDRMAVGVMDAGTHGLMIVEVFAK